MVGADWSPKLAAEYLDARQKAWFDWPVAYEDAEGPCLSCHTGLTYLLARPALRQVLGESMPTDYETGLMDALRRRVPLDSPSRLAPKLPEPLASQVLGVESVLSALLLATEDRKRGSLTRETERAFERLWALQVQEGQAKGAWQWNSIDLDPWEEPESAFYGASLAALALGMTPSHYQDRPNIRAQRKTLTEYLKAQRHDQPLHNQLVLVWASLHLSGLLAESDRKLIVDGVLDRQENDGGWTIESLGPWREHPKAPRSTGSSAYATAWTAFALQKSGVPASNQSLQTALDWLRSHQDPDEGYWESPSMNKQYDPGSMPLHFLRDAATAFASMALIESR